jgi:general secretion pathway protein K
MNYNRYQQISLIKLEKGASLIIVIWFISIISLTCLLAVSLMRQNTDLYEKFIHGNDAYYNAEKGIAIASHPKIKRSDPLLMQRDALSGNGYEVSISSEASKYNLNDIALRKDKPLLKSIFMHYGLKSIDAHSLADAMIDWVDDDDLISLNGAERPQYIKMNRINQPYNRPFSNLDETKFVLGIEKLDELNKNWRNDFTLLSQGKLDLNEVDALKLSIAAGISLQNAVAITDKVLGSDGKRDTSDDSPYQDLEYAFNQVGLDLKSQDHIVNRFTCVDPTLRISSLGQSSSNKIRIDVVIRNKTGRIELLSKTATIRP